MSIGMGGGAAGGWLGFGGDGCATRLARTILTLAPGIP